MATVGYKLINIEDGSFISQWGGVWGQSPGIPNPLVLPNGDQVCAPELDTDYAGYRLILWDMDEPPPSIPASVPLWAVRVILAERGLLEEANAAITAMDNRALQVIWEYGNTVDRSSPALLALAEALGVADELDALFIEAAELKV